MNIMITALTIPLAGTILGSAFVLFMKNGIPSRLQKVLLGFAAGVMVAATVWSLLIPAMEMSDDMGRWKVAPAIMGFLCGIVFLLTLDQLTPHLHLGDNKPEGPPSGLSRTMMMVLAVTIHNLPEGMAVGAVVAGAIQGDDLISTAGVAAMSVGIAIQNIPEGAIVSIPLRMEGNSRVKSFAIGCLSGIVEPLGAITVILLAAYMMPVIPYLLAFAAGAMLYVVVEELIPEASQGSHSNIATIGFAVGFTLMMSLDVILG